jgi:hypothetical protein
MEFFVINLLTCNYDREYRAIISQSYMDNPMDLTTFDKYVQQGKATWWNMELPSGNVKFGKAKSDMVGRDAKEFKHYKDFTDLLHPDDYNDAMKAMQDHLEDKKRYYETVYRIKHKDGHYLTFYDFGRITKKDASGITVIGYVLRLENAEDIDKMSSFRDLIVKGQPNIENLVQRVKDEI